MQALKSSSINRKIENPDDRSFHLLRLLPRAVSYDTSCLFNWKIQIIQISTNCKYKNYAKDNYIFLLKISKRVTLPLKNVCNQNQLSFSLASNRKARLTKKITKRNLVVAGNFFCWKISTWVKCTQFELFIKRWSRKN